MAEVDLVCVEGQDLALGEALLELDGDNGFLHFSLEAAEAGTLEGATAHVIAQEQVARELLCQRARATPLPVDDVSHRRNQDPRNAEPEVLLERRVLGGDDRLSQGGRDVVVADDSTALGGELANRLTVAGEQARNRARLVIIERRDLGQVVRAGEQDAAQRAEQRREDEHGDKSGSSGHGTEQASTARLRRVSRHTRLESSV